jgi:AhpD family alkylhydroperoxidase
MPRVRPIRAHEAPEALQEIYAHAPNLNEPTHLPRPSLFLSQIEVLAHVPGVLEGLSQAYRWFGEAGTVPRKYHELAIVAVSNINRCKYCVSHHTPFALDLGATEKQVEAIQAGTWRQRPELFDQVEWDVLEYAEQVTLEPWKVSDELIGRLRRHFSDAQIVELTARTTLCSFWNKFNDALGLELEPGVTEVLVPDGVPTR